ATSGSDAAAKFFRRAALLTLPFEFDATMTAPSRREHAGRTGIRWAVTLGVQVAWRTVRHRWGEGRKGVLARATKLPLDSCGRDGGLVSQRERALERGDVEAMWAAARERVR